MKPRPALLLVALMSAAAPVAAAPAPVTVTIKSYRAFTNTLVRVFDAVAPGSGAKAVSDLKAGLGLSELKGVDLERPWQFALWLENISGPSRRPPMSAWIPTTDFAAFESGLEEGKGLKGQGQANSIRRTGDYASIWVPGSETAEAAEKAHAAWKPDQLGAVEQAVALDFVPNDPLRQFVLQILGSVRMGFGAAMSSPEMQSAGVDPKAAAAILNVYVDLFETAFKGLDRLKLTADLRGKALVVREQATALAGSDLADWLRGTEGSLDSVLPFAAGKAPVTFALRSHDAPGLTALLKKFMRASLQMQGVAPDSEVAQETDRLIDLMVPMRLAGSLDLGKGFAMAGVTEFPGRDAREVYSAMKRYFQSSMQSQTGTNKPYQSVTFEEGKRELGGARIDRAVLVLNLDSPLYKNPGQREMVERLWPGGRMEFDYARLGDRLLYATPELLDRLVTQVSAPPASKPASIAPNTIGFGRVNIVQLLPAILELNPVVPADAKERISRMQAEGTDVTLQVDLNGTFNGVADIPLRLLNELGKLKD